MAKRFFTDWTLWEKLVFVLGLAIVITVVLGCIKLCFIHRKLRKHTAIAERQRQIEPEQWRRSEKGVGSSSSEGEVPFGVRALESGIEVEGVWHSRSNTPESASRRSSFHSMAPAQSDRPNADVDLEKQTGRAPYRPLQTEGEEALRQASGSSAWPRRGIDFPASHEALHRAQYPPPSMFRFESKAHLHKQLSAVKTLEGLEAIHRASTELNGDSSSSDRSANGIESIVASAPDLLGSQATLPVRRQSNELELLDSRRSSLAAETGHLAPRTRRQNSTGNGNISSSPRASGPDVGLDDLVLRSTRPRNHSSRSQIGQAWDVSASPELASSTVLARQTSAPTEIRSFTQFCQTNPPSPGPVSPAEEASAFQQPDAAVVSPTAVHVPTIAKPMPPDRDPEGKRSSFEIFQATPRVLRGQGSGFEVLQPGSFPAQAEPKTAGGPPISLYNGTHMRTNSFDGRRKLQKKRRMSQESHSSSSISSHQPE